MRDPLENGPDRGGNERGTVDSATLDATERLRARLAGRTATPVPPAPRGSLAWVIAGGLFVFTAGMIANPWFEANVRSRLPFAETLPAPAGGAEARALAERLAALERRAANPAAPMPAERLARTEAQIESSSDLIAREAGRIDRLTADVAGLSAALAAERARDDAATSSAIAAAARAEAMLTLLMVRRAVEAGRPLGALDAGLRRSFEPRYPQAVAALAALGAAPVTLAQLRRDFDAQRAALGAGPAPGARVGWWDAFTNAVSRTISVTGPSTPQDRAATSLARGDVAAAAAELRRLPAPRPPEVTAWLAAADRLIAGNLALATLETASLTAPAAVPVAMQAEGLRRPGP